MEKPTVDPHYDLNNMRQINFEKSLNFIKRFSLYSNCDTLFFIYAHESEEHDYGKDYIKWFKDANFDILSDKSPLGNTPGEIPKVYTTNAAGDILANQFCLLPQRASGNSVRYVIVCGSERLGRYMQAKDFKNYVDEMKREYLENAHRSEKDIHDVVRMVYKKYQKKMGADFHHVLTELALLNLRNPHELRDSVRPLLISGKYDECFPSYIVEQNTILRVEQDGERTPHKCFFKLLAEVAPDKKAYIDMLSKTYSENDLKLRDQKLSYGEIHEEWALANAATITGFTNNQDFEQLKHRGVEIASVWGAIRQYYSGGSLSIKKVSGATLSVDTNYLDLAIVPYVEPTEKNKTEHSIQQNAISSAPVSLDSLFLARTMPDGQVRAPKRILIRGPAGVGKSTICKRIASKYQKNEALRGGFEWVLWIPLSRLELAGGIKEFFYQEYFQFTERGKEMADKLYDRIFGVDRLKTLLILDGWDETHGDTEHKVALIPRIANYHQVIMTSRLGGSSSKNVDPFDLKLDVLGFSNHIICEYLNKLGPNDAKDIEKLFEKHRYIQELAKLPLCLDMICYSWHELKQSTFSRTPTLTMLYQVLVHKLWQKDIPTLGKRDANNSPLTDFTLRAIRDHDRLERLVQTENEFLGRLAFFLTKEKRTTFDHSTIDQVIRQMEKNGGPKLPISFESNLSKLSLLQVYGSGPRASYSFIHLTIQEYFAAYWLIRDEKQLDMSIRRDAGSFELTWTFVAGLLQSKGDVKLIVRFFDKTKIWHYPHRAIEILDQLYEIDSSNELQQLRHEVQLRQADWEEDHLKRKALERERAAFSCPIERTEKSRQEAMEEILMSLEGHSRPGNGRFGETLGQLECRDHVMRY